MAQSRPSGAERPNRRNAPAPGADRRAEQRRAGQQPTDQRQGQRASAPERRLADDARQAKAAASRAAKAAAREAARGALQGAVSGARRELEDFPQLPWRNFARPARSRSHISQERIVEVASALVDAEGTEAVTMRRIAGELGTGPASLYAHVSGRDEVLARVYELAMVEIADAVPDLGDASWQEALRAWAIASYQVFGRHQDLARISFADVPTGPRSFDLVEQMLALMIGQGVPPRVAALALDQLALYIGASSFENWLVVERIRGGDRSMDATQVRERAQQWVDGLREYFTALPPERYPTIMAHVAELVDADHIDRFEFGLDVLIAGLERTAERERAAGKQEP